MPPTIESGHNLHGFGKRLFVVYDINDSKNDIAFTNIEDAQKMMNIRLHTGWRNFYIKEILVFSDPIIGFGPAVSQKHIYCKLCDKRAEEAAATVATEMAKPPSEEIIQ